MSKLIKGKIGFSKLGIFFILLAVLALAGGFFYWRQNQEPEQEKPQPPTLFSKEDYKIEERDGEKFIVVDKVGLTCKVPEGWRIEKKQTSGYPKAEYWINLYSNDAEVFDILTKGCGISIVVGNAEKSIEEIKEKINLFQIGSKISDEIRKDYEFSVIEISGHQALKWISPEISILGQISGIDTPLIKNLISFNTQFLPNYKEKCFPIWEEFLKNVKIE